MSSKTISRKDLIEKFPQEVKTLFKIFLAEEKDSIRLVGGCVRDMLLKIEAKDFDFATKFLPQKTMDILLKHNIHAVPTGIKFGTITAVINHQHFEITTLRKDNEHDGRHCEPEFIDDYFFDAARRDFTINALYLDNQGFVHDYFSGISDLEKGVVKFIGNAEERIKEDFLRILRFFRFSARYAKSLDNQGLIACILQKNNISSLSADRVRIEIFKILTSSNNQQLLWILDEIEKAKIRTEIFSAQFYVEHLKALLDLEETLKIKGSSTIAANIKFSDHLKFAALIFDKKANLQEISTRLNFSNHEKKYYEFLFSKISYIIARLEYKDLRELLVFEEKSFVQDLYLLNLSRNYLSGEKIYGKQIEISEIENLLQFIRDFSLPVFPINGDDIIATGASGKQIGVILQNVKKAWIESDFKLTKKDLLKLI